MTPHRGGRNRVEKATIPAHTIALVLVLGTKQGHKEEGIGSRPFYPGEYWGLCLRFATLMLALLDFGRLDLFK